MKLYHVCEWLLVWGDTISNCHWKSDITLLFHWQTVWHCSIWMSNYVVSSVLCLCVCVCMCVCSKEYNVWRLCCSWRVCVVCAPCLYTLPPLRNDRVCLWGGFALLSIPEGSLLCAASLYHGWHATICVGRERACVSPADGLGWPITHSPAQRSALLLRHSHQSLSYTQTHSHPYILCTCTSWGKHIYYNVDYANTLKCYLKIYLQA